MRSGHTRRGRAGGLEGGPGGNPGYLIPGTEGQGPGRAGVWVGPYTVGSEDSPPGVFCHKLAPTSGLPDEYDYVSAEGDGSGFWTAMAQGEWLGRRWGLGSDPGPLNVWDGRARGWCRPSSSGRSSAPRSPCDRRPEGPRRPPAWSWSCRGSDTWSR